eukprot:TRINITY_DN753_c0_g1_i1.p1 TRINITY_DN753_c0_g1~~TRINITY_DN753_c0_g1_i1.p1  ORF type:complete len:194 (+),score=51.41 TRINITY_DN753_c0_g1_i1:34-615(+)
MSHKKKKEPKSSSKEEKRDTHKKRKKSTKKTSKEKSKRKEKKREELKPETNLQDEDTIAAFKQYELMVRRRLDAQATVSTASDSVEKIFQGSVEKEISEEKWAKRFLVLVRVKKKIELRVYSNEKSDDILEVINLTDYKKVKVSERGVKAWKATFVLTLTTADEKKNIFYRVNKKEVKDWVTTIDTAVNEKQK